MTVTESTPTLKDGRVVAIAGPVVDAEFPPDGIPEINFAVEFDIELESNKITVTGERSLTCTIGPNSPRTGDFHVGDTVRIGCLNGALYYIVNASPPPPTTTATTTTTTTTSTTNDYGFGTITSLTSTTITVTGDSSLTC